LTGSLVAFASLWVLPVSVGARLESTAQPIDREIARLGLRGNALGLYGTKEKFSAAFSAERPRPVSLAIFQTFTPRAAARMSDGVAP
jgi:hypothetical protein